MGLKKGMTNNSKGRPFTWETFATKLKKYNIMSSKELYALDLENIPVKDVIAINQIKKAMDESDMKSIQWISDREDGKVKETIEQTITDKSDVKISFE